MHPTRAMRRLATTLATRPPIVSVTGLPGSGKSSWLAWQARQRPAALLWSAEPGLGRVQLLTSLLEALGVAIGSRSRRCGRRLFSVLRDALRSQAKDELLVDEAHLLYKPCLELLDALAMTEPVRLVLVGTTELERRLLKVPSLAERVTPDRLGLLEQDDLVELLWARFGTADERLAAELLERSEGRWSRLVHLFDKAHERAVRKLELGLLAWPGGEAA